MADSTQKGSEVNSDLPRKVITHCIFCKSEFHTLSKCVYFDRATEQQLINFRAHWAVAKVSQTAGSDFGRQQGSNEYLSSFAAAYPGAIKEARQKYIANQGSALSADHEISIDFAYCWCCSHYQGHEPTACPYQVCEVCGLNHSFSVCPSFADQDFTYLDLPVIAAWLDERRKERPFAKLHKRNLERLAEYRLKETSSRT